MKKFLASLFLAIIMMFFCGCEQAAVKKVNSSKETASMFIEIERTANWIVVYQKETMVMYAISDGDYNHGTFTLLVNADGSPMVYGAEGGAEK